MAKGLPDSKKYIRERQAPLRFGADGKFRILHLTDIHEVDPEMDDDEDRRIPEKKSENTLSLIRRCIELTRPDLVVFGGDNISGYWQEFTYEYMYKTVKKIVAPIAEKNIPLAIVFGNHDAEAQPQLPFLAKENQICIYAEYENFRSTMNDEDVSGCANCSLPVLSSDGSRTAWNIWCIDSGDYIRDGGFNIIKDAGYGYVKRDQIEWYERRAAELKAQNCGKTVPALLFQHIPVIQEYDALQKDPNGEFSLGARRYSVPDGALLDGVLRESPCPPLENGEEFESWKKTGDIVAAFFGHDHINTFTAKVDGIRLVQSPSAGYHSYGDRHGGRLIVIDENIPDSYESECFFFDRTAQDELN